jgi:hypothetical protein
MTKPASATGPKFRAKPIASGKKRRKERIPGEISTALIGVDLSPSSIALAAYNYDVKLHKIYGPGFHIHRWRTEDHYFDRLRDCAKGFAFVNHVLNEVKFFGADVDVWVAAEEPWPFGAVGKFQSNSLKQQAEISGAFLGGLLRYGIRNLFQIPANSWRKLVADDLGITIHHSKWKDPELCDVFNCLPKDTGKFRAKQWALKKNFGETVPDWPDIIESSKLGKIPRPQDSKARAVQCDDRYDALAICEWMRGEWLRSLDIKGNS